MTGWWRTLLVGAVSLAVATAVSLAAGARGAHVGGLPVLALCAAVAFAVNWIAFVPAWLRRTEAFYDLVGALSYLSVVAVALALGDRGPRALVLAAMVAVWAVRLGAFLFARVREVGHDGRFDEIKQSAPRFLLAWTLQGLWVFLTASAALAAITMTTTTAPPVDAALVAGAAVWATGFAIEVIADAQKRAFRRDPANRGRFIERGLWSWSRHPNYFGEIVLWCGVLIAAAPALRGAAWIVAVSPLFVTLLLTRVSGIPLLEERGRARWGDDPAWLAYRARTSTLVPWPPRRSAAGS